MDPARFDRLSKLLATRRTRRQAIATGSAGLAAAGLLSSKQRTQAQDASPAATPQAVPGDPHPSADGALTHPEYLFVQPFEGGAWEPKPGEEGTYILTLTGVAAATTYFSDRPERITGLAPTQPFLDGLGFSAENPPNAAIVAESGSGEQDVLVVQLFNPVYDAAAATLAYDARMLANYGGRGLAHLARQQADFELATSFGPGSLFIDDCPDSTDNCYVGCSNQGTISGGNCWNWSNWTCNPCGSYSTSCNQQISSCNWGCEDDIQLCGSYGCCANAGECCVNNGVVTCPC